MCTGKPKNCVTLFIAIVALLWWSGTKPIISLRYACSSFYLKQCHMCDFKKERKHKQARPELQEGPLNFCKSWVLNSAIRLSSFVHCHAIKWPNKRKKTKQNKINPLNYTLQGKGTINIFPYYCLIYMTSFFKDRSQSLYIVLISKGLCQKFLITLNHWVSL